MKKILETINNHYMLVFTFVFWTILYAPFCMAIPYLDGNIDFLKSYDFYHGGMQSYLFNWPSAHPPFKFVLTNLMYLIGGFSIPAFTSLGFFLGIIGIIAIYVLGKMYSKTTAICATILLSLSPLYISSALNNLNDFVVTVFVLLSLVFYQHKKLFWYCITASCLVLVKETAILLPIAVIMIEITTYITQRKKQHIQQLFLTFLAYSSPCFVFVAWLDYLKLMQVPPWSDWIFAPTANKGAFATVIYNLTTGHIFNMYAYRQWLQLLVLNFNWIFVVIICIGGCLYLGQRKGKYNKNFFSHLTQKRKTILVMILFFLMYFFSVLTLQTYTIPRYALPLIPCILLTAIVSGEYIGRHDKVIHIGLYAFVGTISIIRLFYSIDPVSLALWHKTTVYKESLYAIDDTVGGSDAITYNMQYLFITKKRTEEIEQVNKPGIISSDCDWLFRDPDNEIQTFHLLGIRTEKPFLHCINKN